MIQRFRNLPIQRKLNAIIMATSVTVLALASFAYLNVEIVSFSRLLQEDIATLSEVVGANLAAPMAFDRSEEADEILTALKAAPTVTRAEVYIKRSDAWISTSTNPNSATPTHTDDGDFSQFASYTRDAERTDREPETVPSPFLTYLPDINIGVQGHQFTSTTLTIWTPIHLESGVIGVLFVEASLDELYHRIYRFILYVLGIVLLSLAAAYGLSSILQRQISEPILTLTNAMEQVSKVKQYELRLEHDRADELGVLIKGFNEMLSQIQLRDLALKEHSDQLEDEVEERTQELKKANLIMEKALEDLRVAKESAETANRAKSQFLANMSHEIRTPLNGMLGAIDLLMSGDMPEPQLKLIELSQRSGEALLQIIDDILDLSRIESGKMTLEAVEIDLIELIEDTADQLAERAYNKGLDLTCLISPRVPAAVRADPVRLRQILINLVGNSIKFTEQGEITIRIDQLDSSGRHAGIQVSVKDTGIGLSTALKERIFQSFTQADGATTRRFGGAGLGLAITKRLVDMMGGQIDYDGEEGKGAEFWVKLRFEKIGDSRSGLTPPMIYDGERALVIDRHQNSNDAMKILLDSCGVKADSTTNDVEGLNMIQNRHAERKPYNVVFADMATLRESSEKALFEALSHLNEPQTHFIIMTRLGGREFEARTPIPWKTMFKPIRRSRVWDCLHDCFHPEPEAAGAAAVETPQGDEKARVLRVLLVEDNEVNQIIMKEMLQYLGCEVVLSSNGQEALDEWGEQDFDAVLMDCQMPVMDGYEATRMIRNDEEISGKERTPIIAVTAHAIKGDRDKCIDAGMDDYVSKPFTLEQLQAKLSEWTSTQLKAPEAASNKARAGKSPQANAELSKRDSSLIAFEMLHRIRALQPNGGGALLKTVIDNFIRDSESIVNDQLGEGFARQDSAALTSLAHRMKSSSANVGALRLSACCKELEMNARGGELENAANAIEQIKTEFMLAKQELNRFLDGEIT
ncbi:MAG: response regulator [bacterium]|nr:response regulator [bacterium]